MATHISSHDTQSTRVGDSDTGLLEKDCVSPLKSQDIVYQHRLILGIQQINTLATLSTNTSPGDPTLLGLLGFLIPLTVAVFEFLRFQGANASSLASTSGVFFFYGGIAMNLAGIIEFVRANSLPASGYLTYGCFWVCLGWAFDPLQNLAGAYAAEGVPGALSKPYNSGGAMFFLAMTLCSFVLWLGTLKTNLALSLAVFCLIPLFALLCAGDLHIGYDPTPQGLDHAAYLFEVGAGLGFVTVICGWFMAVVAACEAGGIPCPIVRYLDIPMIMPSIHRRRKSAKKANGADAV
ncbi:hypothetical protein LTR56_023090 [Elasticomyces elasticus]|nr:hypothetical protein LTR56_023090 [Elasticomyces elasticus]KAK3639659.1 hypothetical protein LTR22_017332 [Elasticomyces elasticus]KAK4913437.1 hypothetical protein LTR49_018233 [Elasticomyces elasticus]KAK5760992.1 hypothetical protein LTS12_008840 [Elasticomyces elasticus]